MYVPRRKQSMIFHESNYVQNPKLKEVANG